MPFKITTLVENIVYVPGLKAEHGLCFYIETEHGTFLFDTGQTDVLVHNAVRKNIDLSKVDFVIISHGHYDHSGGLEAFFSINNHAPVYLKSEALRLKYSSDGRKIGMKRELRENTKRFKFIDQITELLPNIFVMPQTPIRHTIDTHFEQMKTENGSQRVPDVFEDELFLVLRNNGSIGIISSCSHRGISNMCDEAQTHFNLPITKVLGGFHTRNASPEQFLFLSNYFKDQNIDSLGVCHCTGLQGYFQLSEQLGSKVFYNAVGNSVIM